MSHVTCHILKKNEIFLEGHVITGDRHTDQVVNV